MGRALISIDDEDPFRGRCFNRRVSLTTDCAELMLDDARAGLRRLRNGIVGRPVFNDNDLARPPYALDAVSDVAGFVPRRDYNRDIDCVGRYFVLCGFRVSVLRGPLRLSGPSLPTRSRQSSPARGTLARLVHALQIPSRYAALRSKAALQHSQQSSQRHPEEQECR